MLANSINEVFKLPAGFPVWMEASGNYEFG